MLHVFEEDLLLFAFAFLLVVHVTVFLLISILFLNLNGQDTHSFAHLDKNYFSKH